MVGVEEQFVVTAWRNSEELLRVRGDLYDTENWEKRLRGVHKVQAWKVRKGELPLLLESTADLVDAQLQDEKGKLGHGSLKLLYGSVVARFITGLADTALELRRSKPAWLSQIPSSQPFLALPPHLLEIRHSIVHREYPSLATLKRACRECLDWLWEWYWSRLEIAFSHTPKTSTHTATYSSDETSISLAQTSQKEAIQTVLKTYLRSRKSEIKSRARKTDPSPAAQTASTTLSKLTSTTSAPQMTSPLSTLLVDEKAIIPAGKTLGSSMSGAFLLWSPLLLATAVSLHGFLDGLVDRLMAFMNTRRTKGDGEHEQDPVSEAVNEWLVHILMSKDWRDMRTRGLERAKVESVIERCFMEPSGWNLRLVERLLETGEVKNAKQWRKVLDAAKDEGMEVDDQEGDDAAVEVQIRKELATSREKTTGPQKKIGLWKPTPIGALPPGWEDIDD